MIICKECGKVINESTNYFCLEPTFSYLCSKECSSKYAKKEKEKEDRNKLYRQVSKLFHIKFPGPQMLAEIKRYKEKGNLSYSNMSATLHYIYDILGKTPYGTSLYLIPQYADAAKEYYQANKIRNLEALEKLGKEPEVSRVIIPSHKGKTKTTVKMISPDDV